MFIWLLAALSVMSLMFQGFQLFQRNSYPSSVGGQASVGETHRTDASKYKAMLLAHEFEKNSYTALNYETQVGVWLSYIDLQPMLDGASPDSFRERIREAYKNIASVGGNTVYVHVRAFGDAYYPSALYPYTSAFGTAEPFDALEIMTDEAHKLGLSFHAWINPLRCGRESDVSGASEVLPLYDLYSAGFGNDICEADGSPYLWLNPASEKTRKLVADGAAEIVSRYDVDGVHIDDYFYPTTSEDFDRISFSESGFEELSDWRRANITSMVLQMNIAVKKVNPTCVFEISPQGNVSNNYSSQYADVESWCASRLICDAVVPQIYYGYKSSSPYLETLDRWNGMVSGSGVRLVVGLGVYKISEETEFISSDGIISDQIKDAFSRENVSGVAFYNYSTLFSEGGRESSERAMAAEAIAKCMEGDTEAV